MMAGSATLTNTVQKTKNFFELPDNTKRQIEYVPGPYPQRGWSRMGSESTAKLFGALEGDGKVITDTDSKVCHIFSLPGRNDTPS